MVRVSVCVRAYAWACACVPTCACACACVVGMMTHTYVPWLTHVCRDSLICVITHSYVSSLTHLCHDSHICAMTHTFVPWLSILHPVDLCWMCTSHCKHTRTHTHTCMFSRYEPNRRRWLGDKGGARTAAESTKVVPDARSRSSILYSVVGVLFFSVGLFCVSLGPYAFHRSFCLNV